jgi:hypothetical protein
VHDTPLLQAMDKYRVQAAAEVHQSVTGTFSASA